MNKLRFIAIFIGILSTGHVSGQVFTGQYNVRAFGAKGDGKNIDSEAINKAIETAAAAGGGTIYFPAGDYLSVTIHLKSHIALYFDQGATLIAAKAENGIHYDLPEKNENEIYQDYGHCHFNNSLIVGLGLEDISILGPGRIWGRGLIKSSTKDVKDEDGNGNKTISLKLCRNVILKDFSILTGGWFGLLANGVDNMTIDNVKMDTNRDGMDVISCKNVRIANCTINSPYDDGICLKSDFALNYFRTTENVTITNCQVSGYDVGTLLDGTFQRNEKSHYADGNPTGRIKLGTESNGGFKNITISNCVFDYCRGLALESVDGALMEDITITNITMRDIVNAPIFVRLGERMRGPSGTPVGTARRIIISNVVCYNAGPKQGVLITGTPGHVIEDLKLSNINIYYQGGGTATQASIVVPGLEKQYPEPYTFGVLPAYGFFIRNVKGLKLNDIQIKYMVDDARPPMILDHVTDADIENVNADRSIGMPFFTLEHVKDFRLFNCFGLANEMIDYTEQKEIK